MTDTANEHRSQTIIFNGYASKQAVLKDWKQLGKAARNNANRAQAHSIFAASHTLQPIVPQMEALKKGTPTLEEFDTTTQKVADLLCAGIKDTFRLSAYATHRLIMWGAQLILTEKNYSNDIPWHGAKAASRLAAKFGAVAQNVFVYLDASYTAEQPDIVPDDRARAMELKLDAAEDVTLLVGNIRSEFGCTPSYAAMKKFLCDAFPELPEDIYPAIKTLLTEPLDVTNAALGRPARSSTPRTPVTSNVNTPK